MSRTVTIETSEGNIVLNAEQFKAYRQRAFDALKEEAEAKLDFKEEVEGAVAGVTSTTVEEKKIKQILTKYFKASFKQSTKEAKALGDTFAALDEVVA